MDKLTELKEKAKNNPVGALLVLGAIVFVGYQFMKKGNTVAAADGATPALPASPEGSAEPTPAAAPAVPAA